MMPSFNVKKDLIIGGFILGLMLVYISQPIIGAGLVGVPIIMAIAMITSLYLIKFWVSSFRKSFLIWVWLLFLAYNVFSYLLSGKIEDYAEARQLLLNMLPFFTFYYLSLKGALSERAVKIFALFLLVVFPINMWVMDQTLQVKLGKDDYANNMAYHIMGLLPFVFLFRSNLCRLVLISFLSWYALGAMKRSVLIVCVFAYILLAYSYVYKDQSANKVKGVIMATLAIAVFALLGAVYYVKVGVNELFQHRIEMMIFEGHSSGRDVLIDTLLKAWINSDSAMTYLFGLGYGASESISFDITHNDFVKALCESGLVGFIIFIAMVVSLLARLNTKLMLPDHKLAYIMLMATLIMSAATSRWYGASFYYMNCVLLPYLLASTVYRNNRLCKS